MQQKSISEIRGLFLVACGLVTMFFYLSWWFMGSRLQSVPLVLGLVFAFLYLVMQMFGTWLLYLATHRREEHLTSKENNLTVDVFVTSCGEDHNLIEKSLSAACKMKGPHVTWLLDDLGDPSLETIAANLGAKYLSRTSQEDAKAGNVNAALTKTGGDIIAIFDIDHVPHKDFLERTIRHFTDPEVGFVQVMPTFSNSNESWVAGAAAETSLDFYNPTSKGMDGFRSVTKMGTNSLIRRKALESIGGYQPGLAEDLATSLKLHGDGWQSIYVAEPLAPGLVPADLEAWFTQQLKWSRGVFELLITSFPRLFFKYSFGQKVSYSVRTTKYWIGFAVAVHLFATIYFLINQDFDSKIAFESYLLHLFPLLAADAVIRFLALRKWKSSSVQSQPQKRAVSLVYATWPIYTVSWFMALLRIKLLFKPTPKESKQVNLFWLVPQAIVVIALASGLYLNLTKSLIFSIPLTLCFALLQLGAHVSFFSRVLHSMLHQPSQINKETSQTLNTLT
ncbi:MAG: cellulose synthase catalytic subunit [Chloroflexota bacterium]